MKRLTCEMCGSSDLIKQDGLYVCQYCGTKYTIEEAQKLMVEIDTTKKLSNLYDRARKSLEVSDLTHASEYYKQILDENPNDWEAYFYSYLGEHTSYTNAQAPSVADKLGNTIPAAYDMALSNCTAEEANSRIKEMTEAFADRVVSIASSAASLLREYEGGNLLTPSGSVTTGLYKNMRPLVQKTVLSCLGAITNVEEKLEDIRDNNDNVDNDVCRNSLVYLLKSELSIASMEFESSVGVKDHLIKEEFCDEIADKIKQLDPEFNVPSFKSTSKSTSKSNNGCYIATAVYGSYDCPEVWTLRRFRDEILAPKIYGRIFIHFYYTVSPTLVRLFGQTKIFKRFWKTKLDKMVKQLNANGIKNTPYKDKKW